MQTGYHQCYLAGKRADYEARTKQSRTDWLNALGVVLMAVVMIVASLTTFSLIVRYTLAAISGRLF